MTGKAIRTPIPRDELVEFWAEKVYTITGLMVAALSRARQDGINQEVIADRLGKEPAQISRTLKGSKNWTVRTLSEMALAMDCDLEISFVRFADRLRPNFEYQPRMIETAPTWTEMPSRHVPRDVVTDTSSSTGKPVVVVREFR